MSIVATHPWAACLADRYLGVAFFDGVRIDTDRITDPRRDRVLPILEEEQILMCRIMRDRGILRPRLRVLDIGTGSGVFAIWAAMHGCDVVGIDCSARAIQFAKRNASHDCNKRFIESAGGKLEFQLRDLRNATCFDGNTGKFDLVLLSPPYNPTAPNIEPAQHAKAGPHGLDHFRSQLSRALTLIADDGVIVGNQMTFHESGKSGDWWIRECTKAIQDSGRSVACSIDYATMLAEEECHARQFLEGQYRNLLETEKQRSKHGQETEAEYRSYIESALDGSIESGVRFDPSFGLYYFEIKASRSGRTSEAALFAAASLPSMTWQDRITLHREIVEHTSAQNSFVTPALFLQNDSIPSLPELLSAEGQETREERFKHSPMSTLGSWLAQAGVIAEDGLKFDFVLADVGPWFDTWEGRRALKQEAALFTKRGYFADDEALRAALTDYQTNTRSQQVTGLGAFLHPVFTGQQQHGTRDWGTIQCQLIMNEADGKRPAQLQTQAEAELFFDWVRRLNDQFDALRESSETTAIIPEMGQHLVAAFDSKSLDKLEVAPEEVARYEQKLVEDCRKFGVTPDRHLELVHLAFHIRLRRALKVDERYPDTRTVLIGVPLRLAFSRSGTFANNLPDSYRGGLWILAGTNSPYGPREESFLLDFARLAILLETSAVEAQASAELSAGLQRDYHGAFAHEIKDVINGIGGDFSPEISQQIKSYFVILAATPREFDDNPAAAWLPISRQVPGMCRGATLHLFIDNHLKIAKNIRRLARCIKLRSNDVEAEIVLTSWDSADQEILAPYDVITAEKGRASSVEPPIRITQLFFFSMAVLAAFRNLLKNFDKEFPICISWQRDLTDKWVLMIQNRRSPESIHSDWRPGMGTEAVLRSYVRQYGPGREHAFHFGADGDNWITKIPMPDGFI